MLTFKTLAFYTVCAATLPLAIITNEVRRTVAISAAAEDECPYIYADRAITAVYGHTKADGTHYVTCTYR